MPTVTSKDGTTIAYETLGTGPAVVLVDGALCHRAFGPARALAEQLRHDFTVHIYDRRGRGESGDTAPYAVEREVEDLAAVIEAAGGSAHVYGISSGAALALEAAAQGLPITKLAVYEAPFILDGSRAPSSPGYAAKLTELIGSGRRGDAVRLFMKEVGTPGFMVAVMRLTPVWAKLKRVAPTLPYDNEVLGDTRAGKPLPEGRYASVGMPTLSMGGGKSPEYLRSAMRAVADAVPDARYRTIEGQTHMLKAAVVAPVLTEFFRQGD